MMSLKRTIAYASDGRGELTCLALFFFVFLSGMYMFDERVSLFAGPAWVVAFEALLLGASVVGFVLRPVLLYRTRRVFQIVPGIMSVLAAAALVVVLMAQRLEVALVGGSVGFCALGYTGSAAHAFVSRRYARSAYLARTVALSYAGGVLLQFVCHTLLPSGIPQQFALVVGAIAMVVMLRVGNGPDSDGRGASRGPGADRGTVARLVLATCCLTVVFAALNAACTMEHASGSIDLGGWSRLILAASAIAAGHLFDMRRRNAMSLIMLCVAMLSTLSFFMVVAGGSVLAATLLFYAGSGFFSVFFTTAFMALAPSTRHPELWASMGRIINCICGMVVAGPAVALAGGGDVLAAAVAMMVVCVGMVIALRKPFDVLEVPEGRAEFAPGVSAGAPPGDSESPVDRPSAESAPSDGDTSESAQAAFEEKLTAFGAAHGFSEREVAVMRALLTSEGSVKSVADALYLSRSTLYRHISSMNKKTGTASRMALITAFWSWEGR